MTIKLSTKGRAGGLVKLAPNLTWPADASIGATGQSAVTVTGIDASAGLTTALSLTGKFEILGFSFSSLTGTDTHTIKLTVDGVVIWNADNVPNNSAIQLISLGSGTGGRNDTFQCETSLLLEIDTNGGDTSINFNYLVRPIL